MKEFINKALMSARNYTVWDYGILKISLISLGILLGTYFSQFFIKNILWVWIVYLISFIFILFKTFKKK